LFSVEEDAIMAFEALKGKWNVYLARSLNRSPLYNKLEQG
jgi:hypothetical protein